MADDRIEIEIVLDDGSVLKGFGKIKSEAKKTGKSVGKSLGDGKGGLLGGLAASIGTLLPQLAALAATYLSFQTILKSVHAAQEQEDSINKLNSAMKTSGTFTEATSTAFQDFASELQKTTKFGDEVILKNAAVLQSLSGLSEQGLEKATSAAVDMAAALGTDLNSAMLLLGKAAVGEVGSLSRYGIIVKRGADNAETFSRVLAELNTKFGGSAAAQVQTFSGAFAQLGNNFGDLLEGIGDLIIKSPLVQDLIKGLSSIVAKLSDSLKESNVARFGSALGKVEVAYKRQNERLSEQQAMLKELQNSPDVVTKAGLIKDKENIIEGINKKLADLGERLFKLRTAASQGGGALINSIIGDPAVFAQKLNELTIASQAGQAERIRAQFDGEQERILLEQLFHEQRKEFEIKKNLEINAINQQFSDANGFTEDERRLLEEQKELEFQEKMKAMQLSFKKKTNEAKIEINQGLAQGIARGIQAMVSAIAKGEDAFGAFAKAVASTFGELAIQIGTTMIATGLGVEALKSLGGTAAIAAGIGLIAVGTILKALAGSSGGGSSSFSGGGVETSADTTSSTLDVSEDISEQQAINVNIQGDVFDSAETGVRIAEIINESFDTQGTLINASAVG